MIICRVDFNPANLKFNISFKVSSIDNILIFDLKYIIGDFSDCLECSDSALKTIASPLANFNFQFQRWRCLNLFGLLNKLLKYPCLSVVTINSCDKNFFHQDTNSSKTKRKLKSCQIDCY